MDRGIFFHCHYSYVHSGPDWQNLLGTHLWGKSSSSRHAISTDIPDPFSPPLPIVHWCRLVFRVTSRISTELLYVGSSWSSCLCWSMWRGPLEYIPYKVFPTSPAVSRMSGSSNFVFVMGGKWPYSCCFLRCCLHDLFNIDDSILV